MERENLTLLTDLYELTMMQGYYKSGNESVAVFDAFFRDNPCNGGYAIACGLEQIIEYIKYLRFTYSDIEYLRSLNIFEEEFLDYLSSYHFTGDIYAVPEGTVVFPNEPLVKVIAPIKEAQLLESALLNLLNHQSLIATKASRVVDAAGGGVMEFGLRRAQGPDAGILGAKAAVVAGCAGTSNVMTGQIWGVPVLGTHAHSWVMSFPDEYSAFKAYAEMYPDACILLVDTYDTLDSGVPNAIRVFNEMREQGRTLKYYGIRLDSGDLAYLSKKARKMLDDAGFEDAVIAASSDLDEYLISSLKSQGARIDTWGVGSKLITSYDWPSFGGVYKLVALYNEKSGEYTPKIKISENIDKITNPGNKTVFRFYDKQTGKIIADMITMADEKYTGAEEVLLFNPVATWKKTILAPGSYDVRELLVPVFKKGICVYESPVLMETKEYCSKEKDTLWEETRRLVNPQEVHVDLSQKLYDTKIELLASARN